MLKQILAFGQKWRQVFLWIYIVMVVWTHFNLSRMETLFVSLKGLTSSGFAENILGRIALDLALPFYFLIAFTFLLLSYAFTLVTYCAMALPILIVFQIWKKGFKKIVNRIFFLYAPLVSTLYVNTVYTSLGRKKDLYFIESSPYYIPIFSIFILLSVIAFKLEKEQKPKSLSVSTENA